jgi:hypothetical protein
MATEFCLQARRLRKAAAIVVALAALLALASPAKAARCWSALFQYKLTVVEATVDGLPLALTDLPHPAKPEMCLEWNTGGGSAALALYECGPNKGVVRYYGPAPKQ